MKHRHIASGLAAGLPSGFAQPDGPEHEHPTPDHFHSFEVSPTPKTVYEPRIFMVRLFTTDNPIVGTGFAFKAPYGTSMMATEILTRAVARNQIVRFTFGAASKSALRRKVDRKALKRFDETFEAVGRQLGIDWSA